MSFKGKLWSVSQTVTIWQESYWVYLCLKSEKQVQSLHSVFLCIFHVLSSEARGWAGSRFAKKNCNAFCSKAHHANNKWMGFTWLKEQVLSSQIGTKCSTFLFRFIFFFWLELFVNRQKFVYLLSKWVTLVRNSHLWVRQQRKAFRWEPWKS